MNKIEKAKAKMLAKYPRGWERKKDVLKLLITIARIKRYRLIAKCFIGGYGADHWAYKYYPMSDANYFRSRYGSVNKAKKILL